MACSSPDGGQSLTVHVVSARVLRDLFNQSRIVERAAAGELTAEARPDRHPTSPAANEPVCTRSQIVRYSDDDRKQIAVAHQYLRTDGSLGASGKPDPKWLRLGDDVYVLA